MREEHQLKICIKIIELYKSVVQGKEKKFLSLSAFLSKYYRENKQMGSRDRKLFSRVVYDFFRSGNILNELDIKERLALSGFICENEIFPLLEYILENHSSLSRESITLPLDEKIDYLKKQYQSFDLSSLADIDLELSKGIGKNEFYKSFFTRPKLWIRLRKAFREEVLNELRKNNIPFETYSEYPLAVSMESGISLENLETKKKGYFEIQDISSQLTGKFFRANFYEQWWDCCAGSGGKSLMLTDETPDIHLLASDARSTIIKNLETRFKVSRVKNYKAMEIDISSGFTLPAGYGNFDGIISDVPCSGSGTWGRTPEMLLQFDRNLVMEYQKKQKTIINSVLPYLKKGSPLIYITCSVFKAENEDVVDLLVNKHGMQLAEAKLIKGYGMAADTLFVARLIK